MKRLLFFVLFLSFLFPLFPQPKGKVLFIIAPVNFRDEELLIPYRIVNEAGYKGVIASRNLQSCRGMLGRIVKPDITISQIEVEEYLAIILVGGSGAKIYWNDPQIHQIFREALEKGKIIGAICISPVTLARAGLLNGKKATVWWSPGFDLRKEITRGGGKYISNPVVVDGRVITANGPKAAQEFGKKIVELLNFYFQGSK